ncbi:acetyl/propionyl/methylcrotonyl-CoA carboxylase subunit alpha [Rhodococcus erythropolis]|uniref:acetyl/propionyl/methylcrotonyl-CoA carboxylase subunit alpha n=1 Tax=Rhodococcus erythropolis TaxID=1833 RepID=UPI00083F7AD7|nr:biotin carboxylase N-terminal domain-containing protein [Rhodococcus erythropolis]
MTRLLIANRGEIVTRIARTARRLGMSVVTISSPVDSHAQWHRLADHTVLLDGDIPSDSYTNSDQIIAAALAADCDAVHPGYGFLSEHSDFAEAVVAAGLTFVGPAAESIALLGDKARAKKAAADAGIPTLTAWGEASADPDTVLGHVRSLDVPVLLKPVFGGGGKGMVRLHPGDDAREVITSAIGLNERNFGRGDLMIETLVERPRHIEVQVLFDSFGTGVHFFTRECSLQRRNQKIIEQAPASSVPESVLGAMQHDALRLLGGVGYVNAATVEFLVDAENRYYFLEVNTRLQVEHTVTEEVTGVDLVELQLDIALGARLPLQQRDIALRGFAVQARIYAEDPSNGFRPAPSHSVDVAWPSTVRIDSAFEGAGSIPPFYDPMIAKVIASGPTRSTALESLDRALADSSYFGGTSNIGFLRLLLATPAVRADDIHTSFVDEHLPRLIPDSAELQATAAAVAMVWTSVEEQSPVTGSSWTGPHGLHRETLRKVGSDPIGRELIADGRVVPTTVISQRSNHWIVAADGRNISVVVRGGTDEVTLSLVADGLTTTAGRLGVGTGTWVCVGGWTVKVIEKVYTAKDSDLSDGEITSKMPGTVLAVLQTGTRVSEGDVVAVVEAMKMETALRASSPGIVSAVTVTVGDVIDAGQVLAAVAP